jgi:anti-anti-sigma factor
MGLLEISVADEESGPVLVLSGEADLTTVAQLSQALTAQVSGGARRLAVDLSGLHFADSVSVRALLLAGRALKERGGALELLRPQPVVARTLSLMGVDRVLTVRAAAEPEPEPEPESTLAALAGARRLGRSVAWIVP